MKLKKKDFQKSHHFQKKSYKMLKLKIGDNIKVLTGRDKGRAGAIEKIDSKTLELYVPGVNVYKKHIKGVSGQKGGIYDITKPISFSKVGLVCPKCKKVTRVSFKFVGDEKKRFCAKCKHEVDLKEKVTKK